MKKSILLLQVILVLLLGISCSTVSSTLYVEPVPNISDSFIMGADVSSLISLEQSGVVFYNFSGKEQDALLTMKESGINTIRIRLWNDPYDKDGNGYGGGNCDLEKAKELGLRATKLGLGVLIDFHYSDFWADPSKQQVPKAWASLSVAEKEQAIFDFTLESLNALKASGVKVSMVQIGNETTTGLAGETAVPKIMRLLASAAKAVRQADPNIQIAVHYTNPENNKYGLYAAQLNVNNVDYDIFASSYYPFWHGTLENLTNQLTTLSEKYGKKVMIAETSWAYTIEDTDGHANTIGSDPSYDRPYPLSVQGQARAIAETIQAISSLGEAGLGVFYWEPAWIAVGSDAQAKWEKFGSGWASSFSKDYDPNDAGVYYGGSACDNQALFDSTGHPLESLLTFSLVKNGNLVPVAADTIEDAYVTVKQNNSIELPTSLTAILNDGSTQSVPVVWNSSFDTSQPIGNYTLKGTSDGKEVNCYVSIVDENYIQDYSFEASDSQVWKINNIASAPQADFQVKKTDAFSGQTSLHFWNEEQIEFSVEQTAKNLRSGSYSYSIQIQGGDISNDAILYIYALSDGKEYKQSFALSGWRVWQNPTIKDIVCTSGEITVGVYIKCAEDGWGTMDDALLNPQD